MSKLKAFIKKTPAFLPAGLCALLLFSGLYCLNGHSLSIPVASHQVPSGRSYNETDFEHYLDRVFHSEVTANTLNLHYTLADPAAAQITDYPVTFGEISYQDDEKQMALLENMKQELSLYKNAVQSDELKLTYDILEDSINLQLALAPYYYYEEPLSSTNGVQSEYPILLAEYAFHTRQDVEDYLNLLSQYDVYFDQVCEFEKEKAKRGLFMNEKAAKNLISQCEAFLPDGSETSFWESTFTERLSALSGLSETQKQDYIAQNQQMLQEHVYPAYHNLIRILKALKQKGTNNQGLCYFDDGKKYYELLVKSTTGSDKAIKELQKMTEERRKLCLSEIDDIADKLSDKNSAANDSKRKNTESATSTAVNGVLDKTPEEMLEHLKETIQTSFPKLPDTAYTVKNVNEKLEPFLSPAFYLTAPMDRFTENCIYINQGNQYSGIQLFTTLAHEGYPGHLYQTVYSYTAKLPPIRYLLYHGGYTEGWATYAEMLSYGYAGLDADLSRALMLNQDATLSLYASIDMGVHYDGWTLADTVDFLAGYGITKTSVISEIYQAVIENPANYLKYYIGYLEFLNLKEQAKAYCKNDYSELAFHKTLLNIGSAPFYIIEKYFVKYYKAASIYKQ